MKVIYVGGNPTWIDASWVAYDPGRDTQVTRGRNFGRVNPGDIFNVDLLTATKLLAQPGFMHANPVALVADSLRHPQKAGAFASATDALLVPSTEVPLRH